MLLHEIYSRILAGETLQIEVTKEEFDSLRTSLVRKFNKSKQESGYGMFYLQGRFNAATCVGTFCLADAQEKFARKQYKNVKILVEY